MKNLQISRATNKVTCVFVKRQTWELYVQTDPSEMRQRKQALLTLASSHGGGGWSLQRCKANL